MTTDVLCEHPGVELRLLTAYSGHLQRWIEDGDVDVSLLYDLTSTPSLNVRPLVRERLWAVAPPSAGLDPARPVPFAEVAARLRYANRRYGGPSSSARRGQDASRPPSMPSSGR
ncbi:LysR substrate-binding domain-containing protein [Amycolatopsis keratiniphila]|uniref:LysR substrate-binding domain-containing protein n=1 Tax=Amycolatopsis keratiniphila TaxID=129921 RepID=UPI001FD9EA1E|nr:LysR substrate-binding domain-containing protein [Amycolatopsis keratiniphila]